MIKKNMIAILSRSFVASFTLALAFYLNYSKE